MLGRSAGHFRRPPSLHRSPAASPARGRARAQGVGRARAGVQLCRSWRPTACSTREPRGQQVLDVLTCARYHTHLDAAGRLLSLNSERRLKSARQMRRLFADLPEAIANTVRLAERLEFSLENLGYEFPRYRAPDGETMEAIPAQGDLRRRQGPVLRHTLAARCCASSKRNWTSSTSSGSPAISSSSGTWSTLRARAASSSRAAAARRTARSATASASRRSIPSGRTALRALPHRRPQGAGPTSISICPAATGASSVIQEVYRRYGGRGAAMTANVITYRGRSAMREIGKVLNFPRTCWTVFRALRQRRFPAHAGAGGAARAGRACRVDIRAPRALL